MTSTYAERPGLRVRQLRSRRDLLELEIRREVKRYRREGLSERKIAALAEVSQPTIHKMLEVAAKDPDPPEGFKGATPMEDIASASTRESSIVRSWSSSWCASPTPRAA